MNQNDPLMATASVTVIVTVRERFSLAVDALNCLIDNTKVPFRLIYIDVNSPFAISKQLQVICKRNNFIFKRVNHYLFPVQARNIAIDLITTKHCVFIENDVFVSGNWLGPLLSEINKDNVDVAVPLICHGLPLHTRIHQAGIRIATDFQSFVEGKCYVLDSHIAIEENADSFPMEPHRIQGFECHVFVIQTKFLKLLGYFDEAICSGPEHLDISLSTYHQGGIVHLVPESKVTYLYPDRNRALLKCDQNYFLGRWAPRVIRSSYNNFENKWGLTGDPSLRLKKYINLNRIKRTFRPIVRKKYKWMRKLPGQGRFIQDYLLLGKFIPMKANKISRSEFCHRS